MKLNYRRTFLVGLAFMAISAFWQMYDTVIPLILKNTFGIKDTASGVIMALDNVLALFMLPIFGMLSDKAGRRIPFIVCGTFVAVASCMLIPVAGASKNFVLFFAALAVLLLSMGTFRSPAVALMPDVTPKPLRSKGNAVINLMGTVGGIYTLIMIKLLIKENANAADVNYLPIFIAVASLMAICAIVLSAAVNERKLKAETDAVNDALDAENDELSDGANERSGGRLSKPMLRSLMLILVSVFLWYMGYNAVTTAYSKYATSVWGMELGNASLCLVIAQVGALAAFLPIGIISSKIGRKRMIIIGVVTLALCFGAMALARAFSGWMFAVFVLIGFAWAAINVNSFPMVVEISRSGDIGKYTGYYYTFSMAAQIITPVLSGALLEHVGYHTLLPYASLMAGAAVVTMAFVRHGDSKPVPSKSRLESFDVDMD